jgi:hypothetical protein
MTESKTRKPAVTEPELLELSLVGPEVVAQRRATKGSRPRSKKQQSVDELVEKAYEKWLKAGSPAEMAKRPGAVVKSGKSANDVLWVQRAIRKAGTYMDLSIRFGQIIEYDTYTEVLFTATRKAAE